MTSRVRRVEVVDEAEVSEEQEEVRPSEYRMELQRAARGGIVEATASSLGLTGAGASNARLRKLQVEGQVQMATIVGQRIKADLAYEAESSSAEVAAETFSEAAAAISEVKRRSGDHEYGQYVGDVCDHLVVTAGKQIVKTQAAATKNIAEVVAKNIYQEADERSFLDRLRNK